MEYRTICECTIKRLSGEYLMHAGFVAKMSELPEPSKGTGTTKFCPWCNTFIVIENEGSQDTSSVDEEWNTEKRHLNATY